MRAMKERYRLFLRRKSVYYAFDNTTKTFESLKTKDKGEATRLLMALNEAGKQPAMNLGLGRGLLQSVVIDVVRGVGIGVTQGPRAGRRHAADRVPGLKVLAPILRASGAGEIIGVAGRVRENVGITHRERLEGVGLDSRLTARGHLRSAPATRAARGTHAAEIPLAGIGRRGLLPGGNTSPRLSTGLGLGRASLEIPGKAECGGKGRPTAEGVFHDATML